MYVPSYQLLLNKKTGRSYLKKEREVLYEEDINTVCTPYMVYKLVEDMFKLSEKAEEHAYIMALNSKCKVLGFFNVSKGTVNSSLIGIREIYVRALLIGASFIILIHNHPSQDSTPSEKDVEITIRLKEAGELLNIPLADHIIVGEKYYSFKEAGVL
ncbi:MAG: JAB domain-containing protein [Lachnospiraceae bacterium]|jgi:DNA repair protein RadC|nr:JAB domain-containing protein [Lachnospiraceae bacterium]